MGFWVILDLKIAKDGIFVPTMIRGIKGMVVWGKGEKSDPHLLQTQQALDYLYEQGVLRYLDTPLLCIYLLKPNRAIVPDGIPESYPG